MKAVLRMLEDDSRTLPVCLQDIHVDVRVRAARQWAKQEPQDAQAVLGAALFPSATVYWVRASTRDQLAAITLRREEQGQVAA